MFPETIAAGFSTFQDQIIIPSGTEKYHSDAMKKLLKHELLVKIHFYSDDIILLCFYTNMW